MKDKRLFENIRKSVIRCAKKYKFFRYCVIIGIAVALFFRHLLRNHKWQWKRSLAMAVTMVLLLITADPLKQEPDSFIISELTVEQNSDQLIEVQRQTDRLSAPKSDVVRSGEVERPDQPDGTIAGEEMTFGEPQWSLEAQLEAGVSGNDSERAEPESFDPEAELVETDVPGAEDNTAKSEELGTGENEAEWEEPDTGDNTVVMDMFRTEEEPGLPKVSDAEMSGAGMDNEPSVSGNEEDTDAEAGNEEMTVSGNNAQDGENQDLEHLTVSGNGMDVSDSDSVSDNTAEQKPGLHIISRNGGSLYEDIYFASSGAWYEVGVTGEDSVSRGDETGSLSSTVYYQIGDQEYTAQIENGRAIVSLPDNVSGWLKLWCDQNQEEITEYVVVEQYAPEITNEVVTKEDHLSYAKVTISDMGELISGIKEYFFALDGEQIEAELQENSFQFVDEDWGDWSPSQMNFSVPLMDMKEHELKVCVTDYSGNIMEKAFQVKAEPQGVISVVLPTSFDILMYPGEEEPGIIESNDIIICNKSPFPIDVVVKTTKIDVHQDDDTDGEKKSCDINLELLASDQKVQTIMLQEGEQNDLMTFRLETMSVKTDAGELIAQASERNRVKKIYSQDYAAMRLSGHMNAAGWKDGDLNVKIVFDFKKAEIFGNKE